MSDCRVTALCGELSTEFQRDHRGKRVAELLSEFAFGEPHWKRFAFFDAGCYTRNLVFKDETYELLVLCWAEGQSSPIHNHMGQNCWMAVLDGCIEEVQYVEQPDGRSGPLIETCTRAFEPGKVAYITDEIALHLVRPPAGAAGVSLHLYSRPYDLCKVYDRDTGVASDKLLLYHSIHGERCASPGGTILSSHAHGTIAR